MTAFGVLGAVQARSADGPVHVPGKQRSVLGVLLLYPNTPISIERLIDCLWEEPPASAVSNIHSYVTRLRRTVAPRLVTQDHHYLLPLDRTELDLLVFVDRVAEARRRADAGDLEAAHEAYRSALSLWRGRPAEDAQLTGAVLPRVTDLEELAVSARCDWTDLRLRLGLHEELIGELRALAQAKSLNERIWRQLILALHRSGRRAEALEMYGRVRAVLSAELGVEPGPELRDLHAAILAGDETLAPPLTPPVRAAVPSRIVPRQLPPALGRLVGRRAELERLEAVSAAKLILVVGGAGVGKTTLAVHWAHQVADRFPDGQLFLDARGFDQAPPMSAAEALPRLIQALGWPAKDVPVALEAQIGLYRSILAGQRVLVVLDNAADPDLIRALIPPGSGSRMLVTSRDRLSGLVALESAAPVTLDVLGLDEAVALLAETVGPERVEREPEAAARLAELCARLPLALRVAAAKVAAGPHRTLADYVAELGGQDLLSKLEVAGDQRTAVRGAVGRSHETLTPEGRRLLRLVGLVPNTGITVPAAAALSGYPAEETAGLLDDLARVHLMNAGSGRYTCHDLVVTYAAERAAAEDPQDERDSAVIRYFDFYLRSIVAAGEHVDVRVVGPAPGAPETGAAPLAFGDRAEAESWLEQEWDTIAALIARAAEHGPYAMAWRMADALRDVLPWRRPVAECLRIAELGLKAARAERDSLGQGATLMSIGYARWRIGDLQAAIDAYQEALPFLRRARWQAAESAALRAAGVALAQAGEPEQAAGRFRRALSLDRKLGNRAGETTSLANLASLSLDLGRLREAERRHEETIVAAAEIGKRHLEAVILVNLGVVRREMGRLDDARATLGRALAAGRDAGSPYVEAIALESLALVHLECGGNEEALPVLSEAADAARRAENPEIEARALIGLALAHLRLGDAAEAGERLDAAAAIAERTGHRPIEVELLLARSELARARGAPADALAFAGQARHLAERGYGLALGKAHAAVAAARLDLGEPAACEESCEEALLVFRRTGQRLARARTLITLGRALHAMGRRDAARSAWRRAHAIAADAGAPEQRAAAVLLSES